jgi:ATP-binding cassette subfamily B protein/subfamily B ATP-binding cassette protein MsbA
MKLYRRIFFYYRPFLSSIIGVVLLLVLTTAFNLLKPWPIKWLIDIVLPQGTLDRVTTPFGTLSFNHALLLACGSMLVIAAFSGLFTLIGNRLTMQIGLRATLRLRMEVYATLQKLSLQFHEQRRSGDTIYRVAYDAQAIQTFFQRGFSAILSSLLSLAGTFIVMFRMDPTLAMLSLLVVPLLWGAFGWFAHRVRTETAAVQREESEILAHTSESIGSIKVVKAFGREHSEIRAFTREATESLRAQMQLYSTQVKSAAAVGLVMALGTALILFRGSGHVMQGSLGVGDLWVFLSYLAMLHQPLEQLSYTAWAMEGAGASVQRVFEILDAEDQVPESPQARPLPRGPGRIVFQNVHFAYAPSQPVLRGLSVEIFPGQTVAFVGESGCGKSTLLSLIPRFYDPQQGRVVIDGHNVRDVTKASLGERISLVMQDTVLLSGSIYENIAYGRPGAKRSEIEAAARAAQAHDFILNLARGYQTPVGERGAALSGGQRQRIGLARAFLKNAPLLLMDEPTSALDPETEDGLQQAMKPLVQRSTTVIVTQRLNTVHHVDCIHVLKDGVIAESGKGEELLARGGLYARLWEKTVSLQKS